MQLCDSYQQLTDRNRHLLVQPEVHLLSNLARQQLNSSLMVSYMESIAGYFCAKNEIFFCRTINFGLPDYGSDVNLGKGVDWPRLIISPIRVPRADPSFLAICGAKICVSRKLPILGGFCRPSNELTVILHSEKHVAFITTASDGRKNRRDHLAQRKRQCDLMGTYPGHSQSM